MISRPIIKTIKSVGFSQVESGNLSLSWPIMLNPVSWDGKLLVIFTRLLNN